MYERFPLTYAKVASRNVECSNAYSNQYQDLKKPKSETEIKYYLYNKTFYFFYYAMKCCSLKRQFHQYGATHPFCIFDRGSLEDFTLIIMTQNKKKKQARVKHTLYTASYPTTLSHLRYGSDNTVGLHNPGICNNVCQALFPFQKGFNLLERPRLYSQNDISLTLSKELWRPGANIIQAMIVPTRTIEAYAIRVVVELLAFGQHAQHKLHAALPKQQAT